MYSFVGKNIKRVDAELKLNGGALYGDDLKFHNMLYAVCVRAPLPNIKIDSIDISRIKNDKDFVRLITSKDIPGTNKWPLVSDDYLFLESKNPQFASQPVALLVSSDYLKARDMLKNIKINYRKQKFETDPLKAVKDKRNIFTTYNVKKGNFEKAIKNCKYVVEGEFYTNYQVHCYLEPQVATAVYSPDGNMTVYSSTQCPFYVLDSVCAITGLPRNRVKIIQTTTGGGFGGKEDVPALVAAYAAVASYLTGKPVRVVYDRKEDFESMSKRHPSYSKVIYGADENGKIKAVYVKYILDAGAYTTLSPIVLWRGTVHAAGPYEIDNVYIESYAVKTHKVPCGAFRGFGQPQICYAQESLIDDLADKIGMDPFDFRLKNIIRKGSLTITSHRINESIELEKVIKEVRKISGWDSKRKRIKSEGNKKRGLGLAVTYYGVGLGAKGRYLDRAGAYINIYRDGKVSVNVGNTEMGQGALTVLSQICAEMLNAPVENIRMEEVDTSKVPDSGPTVASRTTVMSGNAIIEAAKPLRERIFKVAYEMLKKKGASGKTLTACDGHFYLGKKSVSFDEVISECWAKRLKMSEQGWYISPETSFDLKNGQGDAYIVYSYSANVADVEIDTETGYVDVKNIYACYDIGQVVNPNLATGQAEGGLLQGMSWCLYENLIIENGVMRNPNFTDYIIASTAEMPEYHIKFISSEYPKGPYKAKGLGELPLIAISPAIRNAVKNACGIKANYLPLLPEKLAFDIEKTEVKL